MGIFNVVSAQVDVNEPTRLLEPVAKAKRTAMIQQPEQGSDCVDGDAVLIAEAMRTAKEAPDIRADKIERLKKKIASGNYHIDERQLAAAILQEEAAIFAY